MTQKIKKGVTLSGCVCQNSRASKYFLPELWEDGYSKVRQMMALEGKQIL